MDSIVAYKGRSFKVSLESMGATGYKWCLISMPSKTALLNEVTEAGYYLGGPVNQVFYFLANESTEGKTITIQFKLIRGFYPFEEGDTVSVDVIIKEPGTNGLDGYVKYSENSATVNPSCPDGIEYGFPANVNCPDGVVYGYSNNAYCPDGVKYGYPANAYCFDGVKYGYPPFMKYAYPPVQYFDNIRPYGFPPDYGFQNMPPYGYPSNACCPDGFKYGYPPFMKYAYPPVQGFDGNIRAYAFPQYCC